MARLHHKQITFPGNIEMDQSGLIIKDNNGQDEWLIQVENGQLILKPKNKSAQRRTNINSIVDRYELPKLK